MLEPRLLQQPRRPGNGAVGLLPIHRHYSRLQCIQEQGHIGGIVGQRSNGESLARVSDQGDLPARAFLQHLMQPKIQDPYNAQFLGFGTTKTAPPVTDQRIVGMQPFYDSGRFYMGPSQFIPNNLPAPNYFQSIVFGEAPEPLLAQLDRDWSRLAFRS